MSVCGVMWASEYNGADDGARGSCSTLWFYIIVLMPPIFSFLSFGNLALVSGLFCAFPSFSLPLSFSAIHPAFSPLHHYNRVKPPWGFHRVLEPIKSFHVKTLRLRGKSYNLATLCAKWACQGLPSKRVESWICAPITLCSSYSPFVKHPLLLLICIGFYQAFLLSWTSKAFHI